MKATHLKTEHMNNPLGLQTTWPVLSWWAEGGSQTAYEISASVNGREVWNSGRVESPALSAKCGYDAKARERVDWKLRLWDENGCPGEWAEAWYEIGLVHLDCWQAKWIDPELEDDAAQRHPASYLRRLFTLDSTRNARLYITCHGLYAAYLNGQRVGDFVLATTRPICT